MLGPQRSVKTFLAFSLVMAGLGAGHGYTQEVSGDAVPLDVAGQQKTEKRFERMDFNKNGIVNRSEVQVSRLISFLRMDTNGNGVLNLKEYRDFTGAPPATGKKREKLFQKIDANNNGHLSTKEWNIESEVRFKRWDTDSNGKITKEEFLK